MNMVKTSTLVASVLLLLFLSSSSARAAKGEAEEEGDGVIVTEEESGPLSAADKAAQKRENIGANDKENPFTVSSGIGSPPLSPSLKCSACEVTAREIHDAYMRRSAEDRYAGTELETIEVLEGACKRLSKYYVAQEAFGSHMKVFTDPGSEFDIQNVEKAEFWSKKDKARYSGAMWRLGQECQELIGKYEDDLAEHIRDKTPEQQLRRFMCHEKSTVCHEETMEPYRQWYRKHRMAWKKKFKAAQMKKKLMQEVNEEFKPEDSMHIRDNKEREAFDRKQREERERDEKRRKRAIQETKRKQEEEFRKREL